MLRDFELEHEQLDLSCFQQPLVLIDLETTGLKADRDRVIEIAALRLEHGRKPRAFSTLIEHGLLSTGSAYIHGIYRDMLTGAPLFKDITSVLKELCEGAMMVAHNASFEERFLKAELARAGGVWGQPRLCTLMLARRALSHRKGKGAHSLDGISKEFNVPVVGHHEAFSDVLMLYVILCRMISKSKSHPQFKSWLQASIRKSGEQPVWPTDRGPQVPLKSRYR